MIAFEEGIDGKVEWLLRQCLFHKNALDVVQNDDEWISNYTKSRGWYKQGKGFGFIANKAKCVSKVNNTLQFWKYGEGFNQQDNTIQIILDVNKGTLRYVINGNDYGVALDYIDKTKGYRLALTFHKASKDTVIELR